MGMTCALAFGLLSCANNCNLNLIFEMNKDSLIEIAKNNILSKIAGIKSLWEIKGGFHSKYSFETIREFKKRSEENEISNQALNDALLNSMATLIDYYCIYCMVVLGADEKKLTKVQYRSLTPNFILNDKKKNSGRTIDDFKEELDNRIFEDSKVPIEKVDTYRYSICFLEDAIYRTFADYGISEDAVRRSDYEGINDDFQISAKVEKYHQYMRFLYTNHINPHGMKYSVYIEINNYLKHNCIPIFHQIIEVFEDPPQEVLYSYFKIDNNRQLFLKDGPLKDLINMDFHDLHSIIEGKYNGSNYDLCELEKKWFMGNIIFADKNNKVKDDDGNYFSFYLDDVLITKNRDFILIDAYGSLKKVLSRLFVEIEERIDLPTEIGKD